MPIISALFAVTFGMAVHETNPYVKPIEDPTPKQIEYVHPECTDQSDPRRHWKRYIPKNK